MDFCFLYYWKNKSMLSIDKYFMCLFHLLHNFTLTNRGKKESKYWVNRWHYLWMAPSKYMYSRLSLYYSCTHFWKTPWAQPGLFFLLGKKCLNSVLSFYSLLKLAFHTEGNFWHFYGTKDDEIVCFWAKEKNMYFMNDHTVILPDWTLKE